VHVRVKDVKSSGVVIVSNRGPKDFVWEDDRWVTRPAAGGLVSMLTPLARQPGVVWFCCVSEPPDAAAAPRGLFTTAADQADPGLHVAPVTIPAGMFHAYYGQIANEVLWMLQHRVIGPEGLQGLDEARHRAWSAGYLEANRRLASTIVSTCSHVSAFLLQDYHLYPLPALLRRAFPRTPILHFTHIPFPDVSLMKLLPAAWRRGILEGLLGADVVGLQTANDVRAFLGCCRELLDRPVDYARTTVVAADGRMVAVRAYAASVDPDDLTAIMGSEAVAAARHRLAPQLAERNLIRVDRLDPSKNQLLGFQAFARLLEMRPDLRGQVRFSAFLIPSRTDLSVYRAYHDAVYQLVDRINSRFAVPGAPPPINIFYTNDRDQALAAMESCDALLINSLQDGMNLVAKEWAIIAHRPGVLVLSETTGVAAEAADSALLVSPLDVEGTARAMARGLDMGEGKRVARLNRLREQVRRWTAADWLEAQLADLGARAEPALQPLSRAVGE
jgi:trehalose 6-phosphate synthase